MKKQPPPEYEWNFSALPKGQQFICMLYELARESVTIRQKAAEAWTDYQATRTDCLSGEVRPPRPLAADFLRDRDEAYRQMLAAFGAFKPHEVSWLQQPDDIRTHLGLMLNSWKTTDEMRCVSDPPVKVHFYDHAISEGEEVIAGFLPAKSPNEEVGICLTVDATKQDDELIKSFLFSIRYIRRLRKLPAHRVVAPKIGRPGIVEDAAKMLQHIGLIRLAAAVGPTGALKQLQRLIPHIGTGSPGTSLFRARQAVFEAMHRHFALPEDELPLSSERLTKTNNSI